MDYLLIIDDDSLNLMLAKRVLSDVYEINTASSGREGLALMRQRHPDAVLLDFHMPEMSGMDVLSIMKNDEELKDIPIVFLTGDSDRATEVMVFEAGADDYLSKPISREVTIQRIGRIVEAKRLRDDLMGEVDKKTAEIKESNRRFRKLSVEVMVAFAHTIEAKDQYTKGHSSRVAEYSREIAKRLGKTETEQEEVYFEGLLHDTGKIGIPDRIINKNGKLDDEEYATIKQHSVIGAGILEKISELPNLSISAHWHHERYDGRGYPDGLKGEEIPEIARIIAVADTYDAMTSNRSYRKTLPQDVVRAEIERVSGTQLDPKIASVMLSMIDDDKDYNMRQKD